MLGVNTPLCRNLTVTCVTQNLGLDYSLQPFGKTRKNISQDLSTPDDIRGVSNIEYKKLTTRLHRFKNALFSFFSFERKTLKPVLT